MISILHQASIYWFFIVLQIFREIKESFKSPASFFCIAKISWNWNMLWIFLFFNSAKKKYVKSKNALKFELFCKFRETKAKEVYFHPFKFSQFPKNFVKSNNVLNTYTYILPTYAVFSSLIGKNFAKSNNESNLKNLVIVKKMLCCVAGSLVYFTT